MSDSGKSPRTVRPLWPVPSRVFLISFCLLFGIVLIRTAWLCDDAYITFRVIHNFLHGHGLRYNVAERVQVFTHPLWLCLLAPAHFLTGEAYYSSVFLSMAVSIAAVLALAFGVARSTASGLFAITVLVLSRAFVDYSTSGLENPLTHLLLAVFALTYFRGTFTPRRLFWLGLTACLGTTTRMDTLLLYLPALAYAAAKARSWKATAAMALGFLPFAAWELFALFYYGFPFPNTAYAKLGAGIPGIELLQQGGLYLLDSATSDPLTLGVCAFALAVPLALRQWRSAWLAAGILLYLVYLLKIGGDFMSGRFFTPPFFCAIVVLAHVEMPLRGRRWIPAFVAAALLGFVTPYPTLLTGSAYTMSDKEKKDPFVNGIMNSRRSYYAASGLLRARHAGASHLAGKRPGNARVERPALVFAAGFRPYLTGPGAYFYDLMSLADPLRARLPRVDGTGWHPGHIFRALPKGYIDTIASGENKLHDKKLGAFHEHLRLITDGPLLSPARLKTIVLMNLGRFDHLIDYEGYRNPAPPGATRDSIGRPLQETLPKG